MKTKNKIADQKNQTSTAEAREVLQKAKQENLQQFNLKLQALCEEHRVKLVPQLTLQIVSMD